MVLPASAPDLWAYMIFLLHFPVVGTYKCVPPCQAQSFPCEFSSVVGTQGTHMLMQVYLCVPVKARGWHQVPSRSLSTFLFEIGSVYLPCTEITDTLLIVPSFLCGYSGSQVLMTKTHTLLVL